MDIKMIMNLIEFFLIAALGFSIGWGIRDIYINLKSYFKGDL